MISFSLIIFSLFVIYRLDFIINVFNNGSIIINNVIGFNFFNCHCHHFIYFHYWYFHHHCRFPSLFITPWCQAASHALIGIEPGFLYHFIFRAIFALHIMIFHFHIDINIIIIGHFSIIWLSIISSILFLSLPLILTLSLFCRFFFIYADIITPLVFIIIILQSFRFSDIIGLICLITTLPPFLLLDAIEY